MTSSEHHIFRMLERKLLESHFDMINIIPPEVFNFQRARDTNRKWAKYEWKKFFNFTFSYSGVELLGDES